MKKNNKKILGKKIWGPKAWHLLHSFSLHHENENEWSKEKKHEYYLFYKTFIYLIPCKICRLHYKDMIEFHEPLVEKDITKKNISKWVWKIHNKVNVRLGKKEMSYEEGMKIQEKLNNNDIFFFINNVIFGLDIKTCCIFDFDQIYHFFYYFGLLYPDIKIQEKLKKLVLSEEYSNLSSPSEFKDWYQKTYHLWQ